MIASEDIRALADIGFIAWSRGLDAEAASIFEALRILRPNNEVGYLGAALIELRRQNPEAAIRLLRAIPPSHIVRAFLGLALINFGDRQDGVEVLEDVVAKASGSPAGRLAEAILSSQTAPAA